jgi:hypothetical protein
MVAESSRCTVDLNTLELARQGALPLKSLCQLKAKKGVRLVGGLARQSGADERAPIPMRRRCQCLSSALRCT